MFYSPHLCYIWVGLWIENFTWWCCRGDEWTGLHARTPISMSRNLYFWTPRVKHNFYLKPQKNRDRPKKFVQGPILTSKFHHNLTPYFWQNIRCLLQLCYNFSITCVSNKTYVTCCKTGEPWGKGSQDALINSSISSCEIHLHSWFSCIYTLLYFNIVLGRFVCGTARMKKK